MISYIVYFVSWYIYIFIWFENYVEENRNEILFGNKINRIIERETFSEFETKMLVETYLSSCERLKFALDEARRKQHGAPRCGKTA